VLHFCKRTIGIHIKISCLAREINGNIHSLVKRALTGCDREQTVATGTAPKTMTRAMHIEPISTQGFAARGIGSCIRRDMRGFPNSPLTQVGAAATT
jgi:hypothetical protein